MAKAGQIKRGPDFAPEQGKPWPLCGVDEAGRGPWAGPVVAAAVILDPQRLPAGIDDSKRLNEARREALFLSLRDVAQIGIGAASVAEIAQHNILGASLLAMRRAVLALPQRPMFALIDGKHCPVGLPCPAEALVDGDALSLSIAAASIIAKVVRDRAMLRLDARYPAYSFAKNKGYGTKAHQNGLAAAGACPHHRLSFAPLEPWRPKI
jgi:ribonuclease HII